MWVLGFRKASWGVLKSDDVYLSYRVITRIMSDNIDKMPGTQQVLNKCSSSSHVIDKGHIYSSFKNFILGHINICF